MKSWSEEPVTRKQVLIWTTAYFLGTLTASVLEARGVL